MRGAVDAFDPVFDLEAEPSKFKDRALYCAMPSAKMSGSGTQEPLASVSSCRTRSAELGGSCDLFPRNEVEKAP